MTRQNSPSTTDKNKAICRMFFEEMLNKANFSIIEQLVDPDVISHDPFPGQAKGAKGLRDTMKLFHTAFPDMKIIMNDMIAEDNRVMNKFTVTGTHKGEFMGIPATGKKISYEEVVILRLKDEKIVEHWAVADALSLMQQIGAIPG
jgi:steroid delta-isomerase-like uncharacterized protein